MKCDKIDISKVHSASCVTLITLSMIGIMLAIYLTLLSTHYDLNGIIEARAIESGEVDDLFSPHHMLYRTLGLAFYQLWRLTGYSGRSLVPLQVLSGIAGAFGTGVFFVILTHLTRSNLISLLIAIGYGFSYGYWVHCEDAYYIIPATFFVILSLWLLLLTWKSKGNMWQPLWLGLASGLAVLFWQANVFFVIVVGLGLWTSDKPWQTKLKDFGLYAIVIGVVCSAVYLTIGWLVFDCRSSGDFLTWLTTYRTALPIWGSFDLSRVVLVAQTLVATFIPLKRGLGLHRLLDGALVLDKLIPQLSLVACGVGLLLVGFGMFRHGRWLKERHGVLLLLCMIWFALFAVFNTWWDPYEVKWWVIPVISVWIVAALVWAEVESRVHGWKKRGVVAMAIALIGIIAAANFTAATLPDHATPNEELEIALRFGEHMAPNDLLVSADWGWSGYIPYFAHRDVLNLINVSATGYDRAELLSLLDGEIKSRFHQNARVFIVDVFGYNADHWAWLTYNTGLELADLVRYKCQPAWQYEDRIVWEIVQR